MSETRFLVTGGAGFIGSELTRQLAQFSSRVSVVDSLVNGREENLSGIAAGRVDLVVCDIRDDREMARLLRQTDVVFHLACLGVRHSLHDPRENHEVNATATLALLAMAREARIKRFVYVSSSEVYGTAIETPMEERHPAFPLTVYGASKLAGECYARAHHATYGLPTVILRPFNAYGPRCHHEGDSGEVIPKFLLRCLGGKPMVIFGSGEQTRDFTFVGDTARGIIAAASAKECVGETINIGTGREISINDLARAVGEVAQRTESELVHDDPRPGDVLRLLADTRKAEKLLGFSPCVSMTEGLRALRDWYLAGEESIEELLAQECVRAWERNGRVESWSQTGT